MKKTTEQFRHEQVGVSRSLARNRNLDIVFRGTMAGTTGTTILYPAMPHHTTLSKDEILAMRGYCDHEVAHIAHTDFEAFAEVAKGGDPYLKHLVNALEDMRIEKLAVSEYPGAHAHIAATADMLGDALSRDPDVENEAREGAVSLLPVALTWRGRQRAKMKCEVTESLFDLMPDEFRNNVDDILDANDRCKSTSDCVKLARNIYKAVKEKEEAEKEKAETEKDEDTKDTADTAPDTDKDKDADAPTHGTEDSEDSEDSKKPEPEAEAEAEAEEKPKSSVREAPSTDDARDPNLGKAMKTLSDSKTGAWSPYLPWTTEHDRVFTSKELGKSGSGRRYQLIREQLRTTESMCRRRIERAIMARRNRQYLGGFESGRLDSARLVAASRGETAVYRRRQEAADIDTAITLLVDHSGSMLQTVGDENRMMLATKAAIVLSELLDRVDVPFEVIGFDAPMPRGLDIETASRDRHTAWRLSALRHFVYKSFGESLSRCRDALSTMPGRGLMDNADAEAVTFAWSRLSARLEQRKLMIVISDGAPLLRTAGAPLLRAAGGRVESPERKALHDTVKRVEGEGCQMFAIGIGTRSVKQFYTHYAVLHNEAELATTVLGELEKQLK